MMEMTVESCRKSCSRFLIGSRVQVWKEEVENLHRRKYKVKARVVGRYPHFLMVEYRNGLKECFRYTDIVNEHVVELI